MVGVGECVLAVYIPLLSAVEFLQEGVQHEQHIHTHERDPDQLVEAESREGEDEEREDEHDQQQETELSVRYQRHVPCLQINLQNIGQAHL